MTALIVVFAIGAAIEAEYAEIGDINSSVRDATVTSIFRLRRASFARASAFVQLFLAR